MIVTRHGKLAEVLGGAIAMAACGSSSSSGQPDSQNPSASPTGCEASGTYDFEYTVVSGDCPLAAPSKIIVLPGPGTPGCSTVAAEGNACTGSNQSVCYPVAGQCAHWNETISYDWNADGTYQTATLYVAYIDPTHPTSDCTGVWGLTSTRIHD